MPRREGEVACKRNEVKLTAGERESCEGREASLPLLRKEEEEEEGKTPHFPSLRLLLDIRLMRRHLRYREWERA